MVNARRQAKAALGTSEPAQCPSIGTQSGVGCRPRTKLAMRGSGSSRRIIISLTCPFTFIMSLRMRCVSTISASWRTDGSGS